MTLWGLSFGFVQLSQVNMTLVAAPETFEAAMSLNTMAYNTSIALGALFGGLLADDLGVTSVICFGLALTTSSLLINLGLDRGTTADTDVDDDLVLSGSRSRPALVEE